MLSTNRVDLGFFVFINFPILHPPPPEHEVLCLEAEQRNYEYMESDFTECGYGGGGVKIVFVRIWAILRGERVTKLSFVGVGVKNQNTVIRMEV